MTQLFNEQEFEQFSKAASLAGIVVDELSELAENADADLGILSLVICGLLAGHLVTNGLPREEFIRQINLAIDAKSTLGNYTKTSQ